MKIAIDAMGGDNAPGEIVKGVEIARDRYPDIDFQLYGKKSEVANYLTDATRIELIDADQVISMDEEPVKAVRGKRHSSLVLAADSVKRGKTQAFLSAGNTGAILAASLFIVGRIKGIDRPGLTVTLPTVKNNGNFILLDVGANADSKLINLYQYAILGQFYAKKVKGIANPRIGLLNNGSEKHKGDELRRNLYELLAKDKELNFVGNIESRDLLKGNVDVVISDGFTGNAVLKSMEGTAYSMFKMLRNNILSSGILGKLGAYFLKGAFKKVQNKMDYTQYGGAMLLGVNAPMVKMHGNSKAKTVANAIGQTRLLVKANLTNTLKDYFDNHQDIIEKVRSKTEK